jgi:hypothetical protein
VSSTQLLYQSAPFQAAILFVSGPLVDQFLTRKNVFAYKYSSLVLVYILFPSLSCSCFRALTIYIHMKEWQKAFILEKLRRHSLYFHALYLCLWTSAHSWLSARPHQLLIKCLDTSKLALFLALGTLCYMILSQWETSLEY